MILLGNGLFFSKGYYVFTGESSASTWKIMPLLENILSLLVKIMYIQGNLRLYGGN